MSTVKVSFSIACLVLLTGETAPSSSERFALERVSSYVAVHNRHDLDAALSFYADEAVFELNGGRPAVHGKSEIRKLEAFDVVAQSNIEPQGLSTRIDGGNVIVSLRTVVEHSRVFAAIGLPQVTTAPVGAFIVQPDGLFSRVVQPEFNPSCRRVVAAAFSGSLQWLQSRSDARVGSLSERGKLVLTAETIPVMVSVLQDWRTLTGWSPDAASVRQCMTELSAEGGSRQVISAPSVGSS